jgi:hypothetical protein
MTNKAVFLAALLLVLGGCAVPPERAVAPTPHSGLDASALLRELARVGSLPPEQRRREVAALERLDSERRLDDARRFQLAALLEREDSVDAHERGLKSLGAIGEVDTRARPLIDMMKRLLKTRIELKQQTALAQELQDKLEQIKALEKSLQQRTLPGKAP